MLTTPPRLPMLPPRLPPPIAEPTTDTLLLRIRTVLHTPGCPDPESKWTARASGCNLWGHGATPRAAMLDAIKIYDNIKHIRGSNA